MIDFQPNTPIKSSEVDLNLQGLSDGSQDTANNSMANFRSEFIFDFIASGLTIATSASLASTIAAGVAYVKGVRIASNNTPHTFTASKDTYVDLDNTGTLYYVEVANGATSGMTLTTNAVRIAKVITNSTNITRVVQTSFDDLGNELYPLNPFTSSWRTYIDSTTNPIDYAKGAQPNIWKTGGSGITVGNGQLGAVYRKVGKTIDVNISLTLGSTTLFNAAGVFSIALPTNVATNVPNNSTSQVYTGAVHGLRSGTQRYSAVVIAGYSAINASFQAGGEGTAAQNDWSNTSPATWANGDNLNASLSYPIA